MLRHRCDCGVFGCGFGNWILQIFVYFIIWLEFDPISHRWALLLLRQCGRRFASGTVRIYCGQILGEQRQTAATGETLQWRWQRLNVRRLKHRVLLDFDWLGRYLKYRKYEINIKHKNVVIKQHTRFSVMQGVDNEWPLLCKAASICDIVVSLVITISGQSECTSCEQFAIMEPGVKKSSILKNSANIKSVKTRSCKTI